jgi:hypothetical protein
MLLSYHYFTIDEGRTTNDSGRTGRMRGKSVEDIIVRDTNIVQTIEEELKEEL